MRIREGEIPVPRMRVTESPFDREVAFGGRQVLTGPALRELLSTAEPELGLERIDDDFLQAMLENAYLSVVPQTVWHNALRRADGLIAEEELSPEAEWTTYASNPEQPEQGVLLPDDAAPQANLSVFARIGRHVRGVRVEGARDSGVRISVGIGGHCGHPDPDGLCDPGSCGGCVARIREVGEMGLICQCGH